MDVTAYTAVGLDDILAETRPFTMECPEPLRLIQVQKAANQFLRRSMCWRQRNTLLLTTVAGQDTYPVALPAGIELVEVHSFWNGTTEVAAAQPGDGENTAPGTTDSTWAIRLENIETLQMAPAPDTGGLAIRGTVSLATTFDATTLPSFIAREWRTAIADLAVQLICEQVGKPWSNPGEAAMRQGRAQRAILRAGSRAGPVKRTYNRLRVRPGLTYDED